jgi:Zonular occludens toxin (Zot)
MPVYSVEGKLGTGKTKFAVWRAQEALREGRRVASNVDLFLDKLTPERRSTYIRIPDKPSPEQLLSIGHGNPESYDEDRNGVLILDELGTWLNSRNYQDKSRAGVLDWLIHARKLGWDVYLIVQDAQMIDRQVRDAIIEYQCKCMRADKVRLPLIGRFLSEIHKPLGFMPRMHLVVARLGDKANPIVADRWMYRGDDLHVAYDTRQTFTDSYPHGAHSVLPPWEFRPAVPWLRRLIQRMRARSAGSHAPARAPADRARKLRASDSRPFEERWRQAVAASRQGTL